MGGEDLEVKLLRFANDLGKVQGQVEQLDARVKHNCERNETNFAALDARLDKLNQGLTKRSTVLWCIFVGMILLFIGGSLVRWEKVGGFFDRTTASERAGVVKEAVEVIGKVVK